MTDLTAQFEAAVANSKLLPAKPDNDTLLKIYSLFKQATAGDVQGDRPGMMDFVARAKYDAWASVTGMSVEDARDEYVTLIGPLRA